MHNQKMSIVARVVLLTMLLFFSGCAPDDEIEIRMESSDAQGGTANPLVISITSMYGGSDTFSETYRQLLSEYMDENEGIVVQDNSAASTESWKQKIAQDFAVGDEADVVGFFTDANAADVLAADKFVTIDEIRAEYPEYAAETDASALSLAAAPNKVKYAVPTVGYWEGLYCNKDLFDRYELELPNTWDKMLVAIEKLSSNGIVPIAISLGEQPHYLIDFLMLFCSGKEIYESVPEEAPDGWVMGVELIASLRDLGAFPADTEYISYNDARALFINKKAAMIVDGSWLLGSITDQQNTVLCDFPIPPGGKGWYRSILYGYSSGFYITKAAWNDPRKRDAAVNLVMKLTDRHAVEMFWKAGGCVSATAIKMDEQDNMTPLAQSALDYVQRSKLRCSPTDSRIAGRAWADFIADVVGITAGTKDARESLNDMLRTHLKLHGL